MQPLRSSVVLRLRRDDGNRDRRGLAIFFFGRSQMYVVDQRSSISTIVLVPSSSCSVFAWLPTGTAKEGGTCADHLTRSRPEHDPFAATERDSYASGTGFTPRTHARNFDATPSLSSSEMAFRGRQANSVSNQEHPSFTVELYIFCSLISPIITGITATCRGF